jgi:hypothetical protein
MELKCAVPECQNEAVILAHKYIEDLSYHVEVCALHVRFADDWCYCPLTEKAEYIALVVSERNRVAALPKS